MTVKIAKATAPGLPTAVENASATFLAQRGAAAPTWDEIRATRDNLLASTDWKVLPDSPHDTTSLRTWRQALRDLPQTYATPAAVVWPAPPVES